MKCKRVEELLKSDYIDAELSSADAASVKEHLAGCPQCRRLEDELKGQRAIFQSAGYEPVPQEIWNSIQGEIVREQLQAKPSLAAGIIVRIRESIFMPRPVFVLASAFAVLILIGFFAGNLSRRKIFLSKEGLQDAIAGYSLNLGNGEAAYDLGTEVEKYFL